MGAALAQIGFDGAGAEPGWLEGNRNLLPRRAGHDGGRLRCEPGGRRQFLQGRSRAVYDLRAYRHELREDRRLRARSPVEAARRAGGGIKTTIANAEYRN